MNLTESQIKEINDKCPSDEQGIYRQPYGIPTDVKGLVIYCRYETGGWRGGSCWGNEDLREYTEAPPKDRMQVLDLVLEVLKPNISYLQYKKIDSLIHTNEETSEHYYVNSTDWKIEYIVLSELIELLESL